MLLLVDDRAPEAVPQGDSLARALQAVWVGELVPSAGARLLLESALYVPQFPQASLSQEDSARGRLSLGVYQEEGRNFAAAFSSVDALARFVAPGTSYAALTGGALLKMWPDDDWFVLNPGSRYRLILSPAEVHQLADGTVPTDFKAEVLNG